MNSYRRCAVCGRTYLVTRPGQLVCADELCQQVVLREAQAIRALTGGRKERSLPVRDERKLALAEKRGQALRKCHDCGRPTYDYRCSECWKKIRAEQDYSYDDEDE